MIIIINVMVPYGPWFPTLSQGCSRECVRGVAGVARATPIFQILFHKTLKPSNPQALKPFSPQALKPLNPQALKPSSLKPKGPQTLKF